MIRVRDSVRNVLDIPRRLAGHPLAEGRVLATYYSFISHQIMVRIKGEIVYPWVGESRIAIRPWMSGATGNIYSGLQEFSDMGFMLHYARSGDVFFDVGANVGVYTILLAKVCGARTYAFEPDLPSLARLERNVELNEIADVVTIFPFAVGEASGTARFSIGLDVLNHLVEDGDADSREVTLVRLDDYVGLRPTIIKIDVEGYEDAVIAGATGVVGCETLKVVLVEYASDSLSSKLESAGFVKAYYDPRDRKLGTEPNGLTSHNSLFVRDFDQCKLRLAEGPSFEVIGRRF